MKKVEILISAMHQKDLSIFDRTGITTDALLINQCDEDSYVEEERDYGTVRCFSTTERGLSRSRNMALVHARGDYCFFCDDDENLYPGYSEKILKAFSEHPEADIICFKMDYEKKYYQTTTKIGYVKSLRISSCQVVVKLESIGKAGISFDVNFGSGTPIGSGEENIMLFDCLKAGLKIVYVPVCLGKVNEGDSRWFHGFDEEFFVNRGIINKRLLGNIGGFLFSCYFAVSKFPRYRENMSFFKALFLMMKGMKYRNKK